MPMAAMPLSLHGCAPACNACQLSKQKSDTFSYLDQIKTAALNLTRPSTCREEFNEELASLLRNIAEDAKTERATDDDGTVGSRPLSSGLASADVTKVPIPQPPSDPPQPYMGSGGPKSPAKIAPAPLGDAESSSSPAPDVRTVTTAMLVRAGPVRCKHAFRVCTQAHHGQCLRLMHDAESLLLIPHVRPAAEAQRYPWTYNLEFTGLSPNLESC